MKTSISIVVAMLLSFCAATTTVNAANVATSGTVLRAQEPIPTIGLVRFSELVVGDDLLVVSAGAPCPELVELATKAIADRLPIDFARYDLPEGGLWMYPPRIATQGQRKLLRANNVEEVRRMVAAVRAAVANSARARIGGENQ